MFGTNSPNSYTNTYIIQMVIIHDESMDVDFHHVWFASCKRDLRALKLDSRVMAFHWRSEALCARWGVPRYKRVHKPFHYLIIPIIIGQICYKPTQLTFGGPTLWYRGPLSVKYPAWRWNPAFKKKVFSWCNHLKYGEWTYFLVVKMIAISFFWSMENDHG